MEQNVIEGTIPAESALSVRAPADVLSATGVVKWYDKTKGYGFIVPDDGGPDIFLGKAVVSIANLGDPEEGARVVVMMQVRDKGRSATRLVSLDQPPRSERLVPNGVTDIEGPRCGTIKLFDLKRGFGFVTLGDGTADIFFHVTTPSNVDLRLLTVGDRVDVTWGTGPNGLTAGEAAGATTRVHDDRQLLPA
jgi:CspA family cold shock protein